MTKKRITPRFPGIHRVKSGYTVDIDYKNRRHRILFKIPHSRTNEALARDYQGSLRKKIALGTFDPCGEFSNKVIRKLFDCDRKNITTYQLVREFQTKKAQKISSGKKGLRLVEIHLFETTLGDMEANKVKNKDIEDFINDLTVKAIKNIVAPIKSAFKDALKNELITKNPCDDLEKRKSRKKKIIPLRFDEVQKTLSNLDEYWKNFNIISFFTGMSTHEQRGLNWDNVDIERHSFLVLDSFTDQEGFGDTKNDYRGRSLEMINRVEEAFRYFETKKSPQTKLVFFNPETLEPWHDTTIRTNFDLAIKISGVRRITLYQTRHTYASLMYSAGLPVQWLKAQMGHSNLQMLEEVYATMFKCSKEEIETIRNFLLEKRSDGTAPEDISAFL